MWAKQSARKGLIMISPWRIFCVCILSVLPGTLDRAEGQENGDHNKIEPPQSTMDQASYAIGISIGQDMRMKGIEIDVQYLVKGIADAILGNPPLLPLEQLNDSLQTFQREMAAKLEERRNVVGGKNKKEGETFLAENTKKDGVKTLDSGLQYEILQEGSGPTPTLNDQVQAHYHGTLISGEVFDSSVNRGQPAVFPVNGVIPGWTEALQLMKVGDKWRLFIPSELAYAERGAGPQIGPNAVLIFEVELLGIE